MDTLSTERLWRPLKLEDIYLQAVAEGSEADAGIAACSLSTTNGPASSAGERTPMAAWCGDTGGGFFETAVEMRRRLDNPRELSRCHRPQQQNRQRIAA